MTRTPHIPVPALRRPASPADTPAPTVLFGPSPPPPPPVFGSSGAGSYGFDRDGSAGPAMPDVGDEFQGFRLTEELGRGTFGRVFLAHQLALAGRPVALKVTLRPSREPERLARLQHTNVVPVYSVHAAGPMQLICMPLLGRRTLADALKSRRANTATGWSKKATRAMRGSTTLSTAVRPLKPLAAQSVPAPVADLPLDLVGDPVAVLRVLSQLAAGLDHAHGRGILHLDIKPANVLLADTGEPMLLDFNLSSDATEADRELVGGTVPYMAPEQLVDMRSRGRGGVDARTDLYALGVVAFELLTGEPPFPGSARAVADFDRLMAARKQGPPGLRDRNPAVTPAVESIVRKLLAPDPAERYQSARELKEDVDRQLADRPLRYARDRSVAERARKWRRRNPRLLVGAVVALVVAATAGTGAFAVQAAEGRSNADALLKVADARGRMDALRLDLTVPDEPTQVSRGLARGRDLVAAYGLPDDPDWHSRDLVRRLPQDTRAALTADLGEALTLLALVQWAAAKESPDVTTLAARDEAHRYARAATDCFPDGTPPALARLRAELGMVGTTAAPVTARDYFLDAAGHVRARRFADATAALEEATLLDPAHGPAHYLLGYCHTLLGLPDRAAERFALATALMSADPRTFRSWGCTELTAGRYERAARVFTLAADRRGATGLISEARFLRGQALLRAGRHADAADDFTAAVGSHPVAARLGRADALEGAGDPVAAAADRRAADAVPPLNPTDYVARARVRVGSDPGGAGADYRAAADVAGGRWTEPYRGLLRVHLDRTNDPAAALQVADEAVARFPSIAEFRAARAVALARIGDAAGVRAEAERVAALRPTAVDAFGVARALARSTAPADQTAATGWLRRAYLSGLRDAARFDQAADLDGLRATEEYRRFRAAVEEMGR